MLANYRRIISIAVVIVGASTAVVGAQVKKNTAKGNPVRKPFPIVIYPGYSYQLCSKPTPESKCYEVPSTFVAEFTENSRCVGLTLKVVNSTEPEKLPHWYWELVNNNRHPYWFVRVSLVDGLYDYPTYLGTVVGPDEVSHDVSSSLPNTDNSQMREVVGKTCALASGEKLRGGNVEP